MPFDIQLVYHDQRSLAESPALVNSLSEETGLQIRAVYEVPISIQRDPVGGKVVPLDAPDPDLGRNLRTLDDVRRWLGHPSNWKDTKLFIIYWDGNVPKIARTSVDQLKRDGFCEVVIREQINRKKRPTFEAIPEGLLE